MPYWLKQNKIYDISVNKRKNFEPYYVAHRGIMLYDEIFNGCGFDKLLHMNGMRKLGYRLKVLPDVFIVHLNHNSLKNYSDWCKGFSKSPRAQMKISSFYSTTSNLRGFLTNSYHPPWIKNLTSKNLQVNPFTNSYMVDLWLETEKTRNNVDFLRKCLYFLLTLLCLLLMICSVTHPKGKQLHEVKNN